MRRRYLITGRVQGVGFRYFARRAAGQLGITGWVRNLQGGEVEVEAQGKIEAVLAFESELRRGPAGAIVSDFAVSEISDEAAVVTVFVIR